MAEQKVTRKSKLRWSIERRLEFLEFRLYWDGRLNRYDLMSVFGISVNQASTDLNRYLKLAPENMIYDKSLRTYIPSPTFSPLFFQPDASIYLLQVQDAAAGAMEYEDSWVKGHPTFDSIPALARTVRPDTLRAVVAAIRTRAELAIEYQSLNSSTPRRRWISPHALVHDGFRWHVRARCEEVGAFKDFLLARILTAMESRPGECDPADDTDWHERVELRIGPHPGFSESQKQIIELDYHMVDGEVILPVRRAFLSYTLKRFGLDRLPEETTPSQQQIVLLNREELQGGRQF